MATMGKSFDHRDESPNALANVATSRQRPYLIATAAARISRMRLPIGEARLTSTLEHILEQEGEDAHLTGLTRSLSRRLLGLNLRRSPASETNLFTQERQRLQSVRTLSA